MEGEPGLIDRADRLHADRYVWPCLAPCGVALGVQENALSNCGITFCYLRYSLRLRDYFGMGQLPLQLLCTVR